MSKAFQHEWGFMANPTEASRELKNYSPGDLLYCPLCNQWSWGEGKPFKMPYSWFIQLYIDGKIDANESLGTVEEARVRLQSL